MQCQRVVWYAESRWKQALIKISKADHRQSIWMQRTLQEELVSLLDLISHSPTHPNVEKWVLMIVGKSAAIGQPLELPIFVRSLAESLTFVRARTLPLEFDESLLAALDNGIDPESPAALVAEYAYDWWNKDAEPDKTQILSRDTVNAALKHHSMQRKDTIVPPVPTFPELNIAGKGEDCAKCPQYRNLASDLVSKLQDIMQITKAAETATQNRWETDIRRAQALFTLHDAVIQKELHSPDPTASATASASASATVSTPTLTIDKKVNKKSTRVFTKAVAELDRLNQLPLGSYKWTWGPELSATDVEQLVPTQNPAQRRHSGYHRSLPHGPLRGNWSSTHSLPPSDASANFSSLAADIYEIPPMPKHHRSVDNLVRAQLGISSGPAISSQHAQSRHLTSAENQHADADSSPNPAYIQTSNHPSFNVDHAAEAWGDADDGGVDADDAAQVWGDADDSGDDAEKAAQAWEDNDNHGNDANAAADAWGDADADADQPDPDICQDADATLAIPKPPSAGGVNEAAEAWGESDDSGADADTSGADTDADARLVSSRSAEIIGTEEPHLPSQLNIDADLAGNLWDPADGDADAEPDADASTLGADDAADAWLSDTVEGIQPTRTADDAADVWLSDADVSPVPVIPVSLPIITHVYSASDFQYVDDSWLPLHPSPNETSCEESDEDDEADFFD